ncbi:MAG: fructose-bisphosphatase class II [Nitrososphaeria archaeon]|nr:fructose-bisphosphatase class II [Nitrososphaeria archaeon]
MDLRLAFYYNWGEGEKDNAPMLHNGEAVGNGCRFPHFFRH